MPEISFVVDDDGGITVEGDDLTRLAQALTPLLGEGARVNCGVPEKSQRRRVDLPPPWPGDHVLRVAYWWHGDSTSGPGSRTVVQVQGCSIHCDGCYLRSLWSFGDGKRVGRDVAVHDLARRLYETSGGRVTILGGEPFDQPEGLFRLVVALKNYGIDVWCYSGYTVEQLFDRWLGEATIKLLDGIVEGPYLKDQAEGAGLWRGSTNQNIISRDELQRLLREHDAKPARPHPAS